MTRIDRLRIQRFRGITRELDLHFPATAKIHLIYGENGTGKTSIVDAIDYVTNKNLGSIKDKRAGSASYLPSLNATEPAQLDLTSADKTWSVTIGKGTPKFSSDDLPGTRILRRSNVQRFIEATAGEKFSEIKHLLGMESVENAEASVRDAVKLVRDRKSTETRAIADALEVVRASWVEAGQPGDDPMLWAADIDQQTGADSGTDPRQTIRDLNLLLSDLAQLNECRMRIDEAAAELQGIDDEIQALPPIDQYDAITLGRLLNAAAMVLTATEGLDACPVCGQTVTPNHLIQELQDRREALKLYSDVDVRRSGWERKLTALQEWAANQQQSILERVHRGAGYAMPDDQPGWKSLTAIEAPVELSRQIEAAVSTLRAQFDQTMQASAQRRPLRSALANWTRALASLAKLDRMEHILTRIEVTLRTERHAWSQSVLDDVREDCNRIYGAIHPNEGLGFSMLTLNPAERSSLVQKRSFAGTDDVSPQALYSEGHLDTLGFAFWLAHCKRHSMNTPGGGVILIDDVFSSVDADHLGRIVGLLCEEAENFSQIILATHSRLVREAFVGPRGSSKQVNVIELNAFWNPESGTRVNTVQSHANTLRAALSTENFDRQRAASIAGITLERVLLAIIETYRIKVPYNPRGEYELATLLDRVTDAKKITAAHTEPVTIRSMDAILTDLKAMYFIRNQVGAHFNASGLKTSDQDVHRFATVALELVDFATCPGCGQVPNKIDGDRFRCQCKAGQRTYLSPAHL